MGRVTLTQINRPVLKPIASFFPIALSDEECGERVLFCASSYYPPFASPSQEVAVATDGSRGGGAYRLNYDGEAIPCDSKEFVKMREEGMEEKTWEHTMGAFRVIEGGGVFLD